MPRHPAAPSISGGGAEGFPIRRLAEVGLTESRLPPLQALPFLGEGSPTTTDYLRKKGTLILIFPQQLKALGSQPRSGVVRGGPEVRYEGSRGFHQASTRVSRGSARAAGCEH